MSEENLDLVRRAYESFNPWGVDPSLSLGDADLLHPEVEFHTYPNSPEAGIYRGLAAVIEYNRSLFAQFESIRIELIRDGLLAERHTFSTRAEALEAVGLGEQG